jgi:integrase
MARNPTGQVLEVESKRGRTFALRFRAYGQRRYLTLGTTEEGWDRRRAEEELANVLADVRRGIWRPSEPVRTDADFGSEIRFHEFASEWLEAVSHEGLKANTIAEYRWELCNHLLPAFAGHRLAEITIAEVDRYRQAKVREGSLSATSINKTITRLGQILEVAVERELITRNPARGRRRHLKQRARQRSWLDRAEQIAALLYAAGELDKEARSDRRAVPRRALLATLALAGLRIGEALALRWRDVDLAAGRLRIRDSKTEAGVREVDLIPALREELSLHKAKTPFGDIGDPVFPTAAGREQGQSNIRKRVLGRAVERANINLVRSGACPLPEGLTPHSLRRTFISLLLATGAEVRYVMQQVGHADPKVTLSIYAQVMFRAQGERERLRALVEGVVWAEMGRNADLHPTTPGETEPPDPPEARMGAGVLEDAPGRIRTCDPLLRRQPLCPLSYGGEESRIRLEEQDRGPPRYNGAAVHIASRGTSRVHSSRARRISASRSARSAGSWSRKTCAYVRKHSSAEWPICSATSVTLRPSRTSRDAQVWRSR